MHPKEKQLLPSFGRRHGRVLNPRKQSLVDHILPRISIALPGEGQTLDPASLLPHSRELWMEIGFGGGEHLAEQARRNPEVGFIGCEPFVNGMAKLLSEVDTDGISNIRVFSDDARLLMRALPEDCLSRLFILFPDPWPKARHHKRRIISQAMLQGISRILKPGGMLRLATDHAEYATWMLYHLMAHGGFEWQAKTASDWNEPPADWVPTRYQQKGLAGKAAFFDFTRR